MSTWKVIYGTDSPQTARVDSEHEEVSAASTRAIEIVEADTSRSVLVFNEEGPQGLIARWAFPIQAVVVQPVAGGISSKQVAWLKQVPAGRAECGTASTK